MQSEKQLAVEETGANEQPAGDDDVGAQWSRMGVLALALSFVFMAIHAVNTTERAGVFTWLLPSLWRSIKQTLIG